MSGDSTNEYVHILPDELWSDHCKGLRSDFLTPNYIERYRVVANESELTVHDHWEVSCTVVGSGIMEGESVYEISDGTVFLIPPGYRHMERSKRVLDCIWIGLQGVALDSLELRLHKVRDHAVTDILTQLWRRSQQQNGPIGMELDGLILAFLGAFQRSENDEDRLHEHSLENLLDYLNENYHRTISIKEMADQVYCSEGHLQRTFKLFTGQTPNNYLAGVRMRNALRLIRESTLSINEIATLVGYSDALYFSRQFRKYWGESPTGTREKSTIQK